MKKLFLSAALSFFAFGVQAQQYPEMIKVEGGSFEMGDLNGLGEVDEQSVHNVTLATFSIAKTETTVQQWKSFCKETGRKMPKLPDYESEDFLKDDHPIVYVNWQDAVDYCNWLSNKTGKLYRLPTEAEWEYSARGGKLSKNFNYSGGQNLGMTGWYHDNSGVGTKPVAQKRPNELGIYDMSGNVSEWCSDWYDGKYYASSPATNPKGPISGYYRVLRGGSWDGSEISCRVSNRSLFAPTYPNSDWGFRVVLSK